MDLQLTDEQRQVRLADMATDHETETQRLVIARELLRDR